MSPTAPSQAATTIEVGREEAFANGERRIVTAGRFSIGVFRVEDRFYALRNACPHEGAELCKGPLTGTNLPTHRVGEMNWSACGYVLRCPWHAWEFDIRTGESFTASRARVKTYPVEVIDGTVVVFLKGRP